jgi:hypothetical protein
VNFSEQLPSKQWAALTFRGERLAEVWFKPEGEPWALVFRVPRSSFQIPGIGPRLTPENLLKAVAIAPEEVESWRHGDASQSAPSGSDLRLSSPLPQPQPDVPHLDIYVCLKPPKAVAGQEGREPEMASPTWQDLEVRWKAILGLESSLDTLRISMEGLRAELEAALKRALTPDEKLHGLASDVAHWNKAKSRVHHALPKTRDFIHRATWAQGAPERKRLDELFKTPLGTQAAPARTDGVLEALENLRKDRQVLSALGVTVYQECKSISAEVQGALRRLQVNAAARASKKKGATGARGKSH